MDNSMEMIKFVLQCLTTVGLSGIISGLVVFLVTKKFNSAEKKRMEIEQEKLELEKKKNEDMTAIRQAIKVLLRNIIYDTCNTVEARGSFLPREWEQLEESFDLYHNAFDGNSLTKKRYDTTKEKFDVQGEND